MKKYSGFTLVEMLVSIAIISMVSGVVIFNYPKFNEKVLINRAAREFVTTLRDAQARSVNVNQFGGAFPKNYGVKIHKGSATFNYFLFTDLGSSPNYIYDPASPCGTGSNECVAQFAFSRGITITNISIPVGAGGNPSPNDLYVLFYRPDPTMRFTADDPSPPFYYCYAGPAAPCNLAVTGPFIITITNASGTFSKTINLWLTGQISIQ